MEQRHIHLLSNAQPTLFPNNRANNFTNTLVPSLNLKPNEQWEVAVTEFSCVNTLQTIPKDLNFTKTEGNKVKTVVIKKGVYSANELLVALNRDNEGYRFSKAKGSSSLNTVHIQVFVDEGTILELDPLLADILSLKPIITDTETGKLPINLKAFSYNILIYCDVIDESMVGGQREPVLRIVPFNSDKYLTLHSQEFITPHYHPVTQFNLDRIHIKLMTDYGEPFPISEGRCYIKLHLRRVK